ncbi:helix-turn-helix domain-containing protein [Lacticaseibacillus pantheris]
MFRDYFFNKQSEQSFRLFKIIKSFDAANFTVNKLSLIVGMGYAQTYKAFRSILSDLVTLTGKQPASDKEPEFAMMSADVDVDQYQFFLLRKSTSFQFFSASLLNDGVDTKEFCAVHNITPRTLKRLIAPFREYLQEHNIDIDMTLGRVTGEELRIVFMMHEFFSQGYRGGPWPFTNPDEAETIAMYNATNSAEPGKGFPAHTMPTRRALIDIATVALRMRQGHVNRLNPRLITIFSRRDPIPTMNITPKFFPELSEDETRRARLTAYFFWTNLPTLATDNRAINREYCEYMQSFPNPVASLVHQLRECIAQLLSAQQRDVFLSNQVVETNMYKAVLNYYVLEAPVVKVSDFSENRYQMKQYQQLLDAIHASIMSIPKDEPEHVFVRLAQGIEESVFTTMAPILPMFKTVEPLKVRVELESESFLNKDIIGFLNSFAVIKVLPPNSPVPPDVILCSIDHYDRVYALTHATVPVGDHQPTIIYWGNRSEDTDLLHILERVGKLADDKAAAITCDGPK